MNPTRIERMTLRKQAETGISRSTTELRVLFPLCSVMAIIIICLGVFATRIFFFFIQKNETTTTTTTTWTYVTDSLLSIHDKL